jgi:hypothetical protein
MTDDEAAVRASVVPLGEAPTPRALELADLVREQIAARNEEARKEGE